MASYWKKRRFKNRVQLLQDWFRTPAWSPPGAHPGLFKSGEGGWGGRKGGRMASASEFQNKVWSQNDAI